MLGLSRNGMIDYGMLALGSNLRHPRSGGGPLDLSPLTFDGGRAAFIGEVYISVSSFPGSLTA